MGGRKPTPWLGVAGSKPTLAILIPTRSQERNPPVAIFIPDEAEGTHGLPLSVIIVFGSIYCHCLLLPISKRMHERGRQTTVGWFDNAMFGSDALELDTLGSEDAKEPPEHGLQ